MNYNEFMEAYYGFPMNNQGPIPNNTSINNIPNASFNNQPNVALDTPEDGFLKGNMFKSTYDPYKNYQFMRLNPSTEKERLLLEISKYAFATHDLNLYLDLNNNDSSVLMLFNDYRNKTNELINEYETKFGPMTISTDDEKAVPFKWASKDFPWGGRDNV